MNTSNKISDNISHQYPFETMPETMNKKIRQKRTIKNGIVEIDDITIERGEKFINWIPLVRSKLAERESILLQNRVNIIHEIVVSALTLFHHENEINFQHFDHFPVQQMNNTNQQLFTQHFMNNQRGNNIKQQCQQRIVQQLDKWKGVRRSKKVINAFRDYFKVSKNWFDQRKIEIIASFFCIPIINVVYDIAKTVAAQFCANQSVEIQAKYSKYLNVVILKELCLGIIKLPNCGERLLIPAGVHLTIYNREQNIPCFDAMMNESPQILTANPPGKGAKVIRKTIMNLLDYKHQQYRAEFVAAIKDENVDQIKFEHVEHVKVEYDTTNDIVSLQSPHPLPPAISLPIPMIPTMPLIDTTDDEEHKSIADVKVEHVPFNPMAPNIIDSSPETIEPMIQRTNFNHHHHHHQHPDPFPVEHMVTQNNVHFGGDDMMANYDYFNNNAFVDGFDPHFNPNFNGDFSGNHSNDPFYVDPMQSNQDHLHSNYSPPPFATYPSGYTNHHDSTYHAESVRYTPY